MPKPKGCIY